MNPAPQTLNIQRLAVSAPIVFEDGVIKDTSGAGVEIEYVADAMVCPRAHLRPCSHFLADQRVADQLPFLGVHPVPGV